MCLLFFYDLKYKHNFNTIYIFKKISFVKYINNDYEYWNIFTFGI